MSESFILFTVADTTYGLRSREVTHIEMVEHVTPVPNAPPFVDGVVFSRGQVVPAVNLRVRFGFDRAPYGLRTRLLIVQSEGRSVGLLVDSAREFVPLDPSTIQPPGAGLGQLSGQYLEGVANLDDRLVLVLNLPEVLGFSDPTPAAVSRQEVQ